MRNYLWKVACTSHHCFRIFVPLPSDRKKTRTFFGTTGLPLLPTMLRIGATLDVIRLFMKGGASTWDGDSDRKAKHVSISSSGGKGVIEPISYWWQICYAGIIPSSWRTRLPYVETRIRLKPSHFGNGFALSAWQWLWQARLPYLLGISLPQLWQGCGDRVMLVL